MLANNEGPDQTPHGVASDLGLDCVPVTLLWVSVVRMGTVQSSFIVVFFPDLYRVYRITINRNCCILMYANLLSPHL